MLPDLTTLQWTLTGFSALLVGLSKAGFGTGAGILAVPLMAAILGPAGMLPVMLLVLITGDVFSLVHYLRVHDLRNLFMLVPGILIGILLGTLALDWFLQMPHSGLWMKRMIGALSVFFVLIQFYRMARERQVGGGSVPYRPAPWQGVALGACAGVTSTLAHAGGPLVSLFLLPQNLERRVFVGTLVKYFFIGNVVKLIPYHRAGLMTSQTFVLALVLLPCVVLGTLMGAWTNKRFTDRAFRLVVYCLALAVGLYLLSGWEIGGGRGEVADRLGHTTEAVFRSASDDYARCEYEAAGARFARLVDERGATGVAARFNLAVSQYMAGRYADAERQLEMLDVAGGTLLAPRVAFNSGNCAYKAARYGAAIRRYERAIRLGRQVLAGPRQSEAALTEVVARAEFNLQRARAVIVALEPGTGDAPGVGGVPRQIKMPADAASASRNQIAQSRQRGESGTSTGLPTEGARGLRSVESILMSVLRADTGPVLARKAAIALPKGRNW